MDKPTKLYISGPMTGLPEFNYPAFKQAAETLRKLGYRVANPAKAFGGRTDLPWEVYIEHDLLMLETCQGVALLEGWENSRGALLEVDKARCMGISCEPLSYWLNERESQEVNLPDYLERINDAIVHGFPSVTTPALPVI